MSDPQTPTSAFAIYSSKRKSMSPGTTKKNNKKVPDIEVETSKSPLPKPQQISDKQLSSLSPSVVLNRLNSSPNGVNENNASPIIKTINESNLEDEISRKLSKAIRKEKKLSKKNNTLKEGKGEQKVKPKLRIVLKTSKKALRNEKLQRKMKKTIRVPSPMKIIDEEMYKNNFNPLKDTSRTFQWLIHPFPVDDFFKNSWEKTPVHIKRSIPNYYTALMSTAMIDDILRKNNILYSKNLDITSYSNGQRETHNPQGRALPSVVWDYYSNGCSIRMLNPQTYIKKIHTLNATLQELFGCFVGSNFYLTPPGSQGFAPHYDDIEAFILQIEGKKHWRLYNPRNQSEYLPRYSSDNFNPSEIGEPIIDVILHPGDLLYFPRGTIHQGETLEDSHSLHLTLSVYQKNSWGDYLEKLLPTALSTTIANNSELREGLPLNYLNKLGCVFKDQNKDEEFRKNFIEKTKLLLHKVIENIDIDAAVDEMAMGHVHDFLPPVLTPMELECSILEDGERMGANGAIENRVEIEPDTRIRLARSHSVRLIEKEDVYRLYYSADNSREYHEYEVQFLEVGKDLAPAVAKIISVYPEFIKVDELPVEGEDNKVQVARDLWEKCIIVTEVPLPTVD
ncbi:hypothetical protein PV327_005947 [Microctonus hyperodae]|uniref:Bifunctional lysine-specific demethylase and histidyl-hydroxylase n=1 Tax=Microctonus hyperodae TaxID=165561 RepID=A0AA39G2E9_MICHY|nr:hypothetical protein PV327_005947 [Microctonus hyperodae]